MEKNKQSRRHFLSRTVPLALGGAVATGYLCQSCGQNPEEDETVSLLTPDGKVVRAKKSDLSPAPVAKAHVGMPGKHWVMVVDLARCKNARRCVNSCAKHHQLPPERPFIKVLQMQDNELSSPYWMPKKCFHCDNPPCVKVCPVGATFKRSDGLVLIDNERCIGCRFCMAACPYSARVFNWSKPENQDSGQEYSPETSVPSKIGTVEKCDFCPDMLRKDKPPHCISACPNGALFFGDRNSDTVTNGPETFQLSTLLKEKAAYRYLEELGTEPNVYYLPPVDRLVPFEETVESSNS